MYSDPAVEALGSLSGMYEDEMGERMSPEYGSKAQAKEAEQVAAKTAANFMDNQAEPKNIHGQDPSQPGVEFSEDEMSELGGYYESIPMETEEIGAPGAEMVV